ncbi:hypothetical protein D3C72_1819260 [compost metagenome]
MRQVQNGVRTRQLLRADGPAAGDRDLFRVADDRAGFAGVAEARVAVEEDVHLGRGAEGQRLTVVDLGLQHGAGDEEVGRGRSLAVGAQQHVLNRRAQGRGQTVRRAYGDDAAAAAHEGVDLRQGCLGRDVAQPATILGRD